MKNILRKAFLLAAEYHQHQKYGEDPYLVHLYDVVNVLIEYGYTHSKYLATAWLHDTIEDSTLGYYKIKAEVGEDVAEMVFAVTDELGRSRKERKAKTLPKLNGKIDAQVVKLADWIANVRNAHYKRPDLIQMYQKDFKDFEKAVRHQADSGMETMWLEIENLLG
jgi:(p)ppGpp synthase/HD superfamily hydrolase